MTELPNPGQGWSYLNKSRTRANRTMFGTPQDVNPRTRSDYLNKKTQKAKILGIENPDVFTEAEEAGFNITSVYNISSKEEIPEAQETWMSEDVWNYFSPKSGTQRAPRGAEYENYADTPIYPEKTRINRKTGEREVIDRGAFDVNTGLYVSTEPVNFDIDDQDNIEYPTATENPERPRTVAAAFDDERSIITIIFRDGTVYNYYNCTKYIWGQFKDAPSKGKFLLSTLDAYPRGIANMAYIPEEIRILAYGLARAEQVRIGKAAGKIRQPARYTDIKRAKANGQNPADYRMKRVKSKGNKR